MPSDEIEKTRSEIIHLAREIIEGGEAVVDDSEQLAAKYRNHKPLDVEGFRVALHLLFPHDRHAAHAAPSAGHAAHVVLAALRVGCGRGHDERQLG